MADRTIPVYSDGYEIQYHSSDDLYHCLHKNEGMMKKDGKPTAYRSLKLASNFMQSQGVQEAVKEQPKKGGLWTPPPAAVIMSLEEQLAVLPENAPRFVVVEAGYATYKEQGYACYDRQEKRYQTHAKGPSQSWNDVFRSRDRAEQTCVLCNQEPPVRYEYDDEFAAIIAADNANDNYIPYHTEVTPPPAEKECTFVGSDQYSVGDIITDKYGRKYRATKPSFYISEREAADLEDGFDTFVDAGWHTDAALVEDE